MAASNAEQVKDMLNAMGVESIDDSPAPIAPPAEPVQAASVEGPRNAGGPNAAELKLTASRDMNVSTLVHLLGVASAAQVDMLDARIESLNTKLASVMTKIERIAADVESAKNDTVLDRLEHQLADIRALLKKGIPGSGISSSKGDERKAADGRKPLLMTSAPAPGNGAAQTAEPAAQENGAEAQGTEPQAAPEQRQKKGPGDASFQATEAKRIRGMDNET